MKLDFIRFHTPDGIELQGWLSNAEGDTAVIHMHGMSGSGYENAFLDSLHSSLPTRGISFFSIDNRGRGIVSSFWQKDELSRWGEGTKPGGSCFEIFDESVYDIKGAMDYLRTLGKTKFILQGHSLGCAKVVHYLTSQDTSDIVCAVLLAPTDMVGWASRDARHEEYVARAKQLIAEGKPMELVSAQCWPDETPLSAQTYASICVAGTSSDMYGAQEGGPLLSRLSTKTQIIYGTNDIGVEEIDGSIEAWKMRAEPLLSSMTHISTIEGASHSFKGYEDELTQVILKFI